MIIPNWAQIHEEIFGDSKEPQVQTYTFDVRLIGQEEPPVHLQLDFHSRDGICVLVESRQISNEPVIYTVEPTTIRLDPSSTPRSKHRAKE